MGNERSFSLRGRVGITGGVWGGGGGGMDRSGGGGADGYDGDVIICGRGEGL